MKTILIIIGLLVTYHISWILFSIFVFGALLHILT